MAISTSQGLVQRFAMGLYGVQLGNTTMAAVLDEVKTIGGITKIDGLFNWYYTVSFGSKPVADVAASLATNLGIVVGQNGLTAGFVTFAKDYIAGVLNAAAPEARGAAVSQIIAAWEDLAGTAEVGAAVSAWTANTANALAYASGAQNTADVAIGTAVTQFTLTTGQDKFVGSAGNDMFLARTINNGNTLQDGDQINGGAGNDTLVADLVSQSNAITPVLTNVETVVIRAQTTTTDNTNGNNLNGFGVFIDAQRSLAVDSLNTVTAATGVTRWESNNSRSDVIIEDVRIGNDQKTSDVTIAFVESDPGNVDFGVYFDQHSLRNTSSGTTGINILLMDPAAARVEATAATPLLNHNFNTYTFFVDNVKVILGGANTPAGKALDDATTYPALKAAFELALKTASVGGVTEDLSGVVAVTMSGVVNMTAEAKKAAESAVVAESFLNLSGQVITLTTAGSSVISSKSASGEAGGWTAAGPAPSTGAIVQTFNTGTTSVTELVTSKIVLDDVGRGSTGGDLVVGGMSVGSTSTSRGVERFEITVNDNSKLQTINSTNNALREVTIVNGATSKTVANAYTTTVKDEGDLTVNGTVGAGDTRLAGVDTYSRGTTLPGGVAQTHAGAGAAGFTDVRLIDASAFKGKLAFTAAITADSITKYVTAVDTSANPAADVATVGGNANFNVAGANFIYTGGNDNDTMTVGIDAAAASSRSTVVSGLSDMTFKMDGGAGDDAITVTVINPALAGGAQAWYNNQKLNANIRIDGGDGNDVIRTPGAGDVVIDGGAGNDVVYTDNTGALNATTNTSGIANPASIAYRDAAAAELAAAQAAIALNNSTSFVRANAALAALDAIDVVTPNNLTVTVPAVVLPTYAAVHAAIAGELAAGTITGAQAVALATAYNTSTTTVTATAPVALAAPTALAGVTGRAGTIAAADMTAGDTLLANYMTTAKASVATAQAAFDNVVTQAALLNPTQLAVVVAAHNVNAVLDADGAIGPLTAAPGTATIVAGLATLKAALVPGKTVAEQVEALNAATDAGVITPVDAANILAAGGNATLVAGAPITAITNILQPLQDVATVNNTAANVALTAALAADAAAVNTAAGFAATDSVGAFIPDGIAPDAVGNVQTAAAQAAAVTAAGRADVDLAAAKAINAALVALKAAVNVGTTDVDVNSALIVAQGATAAAALASATNGNGAVADLIAGPVVFGALQGLAGVGGGGATVIAAEEVAFDTGAGGILAAGSVDSFIKANNAVIDRLTIVKANADALVTATTTANTIALAAAKSGANDFSAAAPKAVFVFNTSNQADSYNRLTADDRNLADLKSDVNNTHNFFNSTVKVSYKGIDASTVVAGSGYKTTDLEINQALKNLINTNAVLKHLLLATDGPGNTLVVTSLIDGTQKTADLAVSVTAPATGVLAAADIAGAAAAYGLPAGTTDAALNAVMVTANTAFNTKGDYKTQFAESGAAGGNVTLTGANSTSSSDNTVTGGVGNDVIVLGTTVGTDGMTSSNEKVVFSGSFGNDTIVNFATSGLGMDTLDFSALNGRGNVALNSLTADKSIVIAAPTAAGATALTADQIAALFTDSATAISHVYVAVDATNIGSIWQVADAAGTAAGNVTAKLVGSIDLADTPWANLTAANFA